MSAIGKHGGFPYLRGKMHQRKQRLQTYILRLDQLHRRRRRGLVPMHFYSSFLVENICVRRWDAECTMLPLMGIDNDKIVFSRLLALILTISILAGERGKDIGG